MELIDLIFKVGELSAIVIVIVLFLNYIKARDKDMKEMFVASMGVLRETTVAIKDLEKQIQLLPTKINRNGQ